MASRLMRERQNQAQPDKQSCAYSDDDLDQHGRLSLGKLSRRQQVFAFGPELHDAHLLGRVGARKPRGVSQKSGPVTAHTIST